MNERNILCQIRLDLRRVLADQKLVELRGAMPATARLAAGRGGDLAPAGDAFVGRHLDEEGTRPNRCPAPSTSQGTSFVIFMIPSRPSLVRPAATWTSVSATLKPFRHAVAAVVEYSIGHSVPRMERFIRGSAWHLCVGSTLAQTP